VFFIAPLCLIVVYSFWETKNYELVPTFTTKNYETIITTGTYVKTFVKTVIMALLATIATLALADGERWLALGDMAELGADARALHAGVGAKARERGIERLFAVGPLGAATVEAFGTGGEHYADKAALIAALKAGLHGGVTCLVKGSHSAGMDEVVRALEGASEHAVTKPEGASDAA